MSLSEDDAEPGEIVGRPPAFLKRGTTLHRRRAAGAHKPWRLSCVCVCLINLGLLFFTLLTSVNNPGQGQRIVPVAPDLALLHTVPVSLKTLVRSRPISPQQHSFVPLIYSGNTYLPEVALTFDDGPNPLYTPQILAILKRFRVPATFFCIGQQAARWPTLVKQELAAGNDVGDHTWDHTNLSWLSDAGIFWEIQSTLQELKRQKGVASSFFRPPYGAFTSDVLVQAERLHAMTVLWNIDPTDWRRPGTPAIVNVIEKNMHNGAIVLLHDGGGDRSQTVAALPIVIGWLHQHGYRIVSLQQMIDHLRYLPPLKHPSPPAQIRSALLPRHH